MCAGTGPILLPVVSRCLPLSPTFWFLFYFTNQRSFRRPGGAVGDLDPIVPPTSVRGNWSLLLPVVSRGLPLSPASCLWLHSPNKRSFSGPGGVVKDFDPLSRLHLCAGTSPCCFPLSPVVSRCLPLSPVVPRYDVDQHSYIYNYINYK